MYENNGKKLNGVVATKTDSTGTGYYRDRNGEYFYGNKQNGYLTPTADTLRRRQKAAGTSSTYSAPSGSASSTGRASIGEAFLLSACYKAGAVGTTLLMKLVDIAVAILKIVISAYLIIDVAGRYSEFCPLFQAEFLALNILFVVFVVAALVGGILLAVLRHKDYSKVIYYVMMAATFGICMLNLNYTLLGNIIAGAFVAFFYVQIPKVIMSIVAKCVA